MPIRTPRGRSAAYRAIWQWPLRSPVRLALVVVAVLAVAVGTTIGLGLLRGPEAAAPLACSGLTTYSAIRRIPPATLARTPVIVIGDHGPLPGRLLGLSGPWHPAGVSCPWWGSRTRPPSGPVAEAPRRPRVR